MADQNANARAETATDSRGRARSVSPDCSELPASFANDAISGRSRSQYADEIADDLNSSRLPASANSLLGTSISVPPAVVL
jgi:hypothetical protein